ncbi:hypothetical protein Hsw_4263 [Hymenobacter swuensis DY53]|uniref:Uncharacterized protein n=1 Tax=Hymenobacter swuensis DY53 TaxID=1227739 RepID=W8F4F6_9BACT|nr:hypothetical protein Hsw_4263 [Hymenobacter swuensis DY53]
MRRRRKQTTAAPFHYLMTIFFGYFAPLSPFLTALFFK